MLCLLFEAGGDKYALDVTQVAEVLPLVDLKKIPHAPPEVAGACNYRGVPLPVIDICQLTVGESARPRMSTRIIVVHYHEGDGIPRQLGLLVEKATETIKKSASEFVASGLTNPWAPYLGEMAADRGGLIQRIDVATVLSPYLKELLFPPPRAA